MNKLSTCLFLISIFFSHGCIHNNPYVAKYLSIHQSSTEKIKMTELTFTDGENYWSTQTPWLFGGGDEYSDGRAIQTFDKKLPPIGVSAQWYSMKSKKMYRVDAQFPEYLEAFKKFQEKYPVNVYYYVYQSKIIDKDARYKLWVDVSCSTMSGKCAIYDKNGNLVGSKQPRFKHEIINIKAKEVEFSALEYRYLKELQEGFYDGYIFVMHQMAKSKVKVKKIKFSDGKKEWSTAPLLDGTIQEIGHLYEGVTENDVFRPIPTSFEIQWYSYETKKMYEVKAKFPDLTKKFEKFASTYKQEDYTYAYKYLIYPKEGKIKMWFQAHCKTMLCDLPPSPPLDIFEQKGVEIPVTIKD